MSRTSLISMSLGGIFGGLCLLSSLAFAAVPAQPAQPQSLPAELPDNSAGLLDLLGEGTTIAQLGRRRRRGRSRTRIPSRTRTRIPSRSRTRTRIPSRTRTRIPSRTRTRIPSRTRTRIPSRSRTRTRIPSRNRGIQAAFVQIAPGVMLNTTLAL